MSRLVIGAEERGAGNREQGTRNKEQGTGSSPGFVMADTPCQ